MTLPFIKMHGLGNDFAIIDARQAQVAITPERARLLADRRRGIGCDQLILLEPSTYADTFMRIFNPDGSESSACGNATRCVAHLLGGRAVIETRAGLLAAEESPEGIAVNMGKPRFEWDQIPLAYPMDTREMPVSWDGLERPSAVSMGNPHVIFFTIDCDAIDLTEIGPRIENDPLFPARVNVNVATVVARDRLRLRVWERGAGLTLACGSGACATFAAARRRGLVESAAQVELPGGWLRISETADGEIRMSGPATVSFKGTTDL